MRRLLLGVIAAALLVWPAAITSADPLTAWTPGPNAVQDNTYAGAIDLPAMNATEPIGDFGIAGWVVDESADGWTGIDDVQIWLGAMGSGGAKLLTDANVGFSRPDVALALGNPYWTDSGFKALVPVDVLTAGPQTLFIYAHTPDKGWWYRQLIVNISPTLFPLPVLPPVSASALPIVNIEAPTNGQVVPTTSDFVISGYALDKYATVAQGVAGSGVDRVEVYLGADRDHGGTLLGDATLGFNDPVAPGIYGQQFASAGWRLTFTPTRFDNNTYLLYVYAHSVVSGKEDVAVRFFAIRDTP